MNKKRFLQALIILLSTHTTAYTGSFSDIHCPKIDDSSYLTQNNNGRSTYRNNGAAAIFKYFIRNENLDLSKPILDAGAGYGSASYDLINLGAKHIYINDLSGANLFCLKKNLHKLALEKKAAITYLPGDISQPSLFKKIPPHSLGLIFSCNVIHFFSAQQFIMFIKESSTALEKNGMILLTFENPLLEQQTNLINTIEQAFALDRSLPPLSHQDEIVIQHYKATSFLYRNQRSYCSSKEYENTPAEFKAPGFPCMLENSNYYLLTPEIIALVLEKFGFQNITMDQKKDKYGTIMIIAKKH